MVSKSVLYEVFLEIVVNVDAVPIMRCRKLLLVALPQQLLVTSMVTVDIDYIIFSRERGGPNYLYFIQFHVFLACNRMNVQNIDLNVF